MHHSGDYLLVAKYNDGTIWKIDEKDPKKMEQVAIAEKLPNADGMLLTGDGELVVVQNGDVNRVVRLKSTDGFKTAKVEKVVQTTKDFPTTVVAGVGGKLYVMMSRLGELFADPAKAKSDSFTLMELKFERGLVRGRSIPSPRPRGEGKGEGSVSGGSTMSRPPLPPFTFETAVQKVRMAEDAWNSRDPERVAGAYTEDSRWRNRAEFFQGRAAIVAFLRRKWAREIDYRLIKELWAFHENRIAVRFQYEWRDDSGHWFRSYGNEQWEFDDAGLMRRREASINDVAIADERPQVPLDRARGAAGGSSGPDRARALAAFCPVYIGGYFLARAQPGAPRADEPACVFARVWSRSSSSPVLPRCRVRCASHPRRTPA